MKHIMIPDLQIRPDTPTDHLSWISAYVAEKKPDVIVQIGDAYDMASLSSYDKGKKKFEGRRYIHDIEAGNEGWRLLNEHILAEINRQKANKKKAWNPRKVYTLGNHEFRIERAVDDDARLEGTIGYKDFLHEGWERHGFLEVVWIDGIAYSHYFAQPLSGRPFGGQSIDTRLKSIGHSFSMGHQQVLMFGRRETVGAAHYGLVAGNCYLHDEEYRGPQANNEWRGIIVKHGVKNGEYDPMFVSLDYLCQKYEGVGLEEFMVKKGYK